MKECVICKKKQDNIYKRSHFKSVKISLKSFYIDDMYLVYESFIVCQSCLFNKQKEIRNYAIEIIKNYK